MLIIACPYSSKIYHEPSSETNAPTVNLDDILEVLAQNNFSNKKQADLLEIINFILHKKHYPQDICGNLEKKIRVLKQAEQEAGAPSSLRLSPKKGFKVNFIRIINCLCELSFFTDKKGNDITKKEVFETFGKAINQNLSAFQNDLSTTKAAANSDMRNTLAIFEQMHAKQKEISQK